ncbi:MAG: hypothetical protein GY868_12805 [Deltaproteobacteria bacterium]|nr:hypothetical protein [Deltaproteobacteria bacterium]
MGFEKPKVRPCRAFIFLARGEKTTNKKHRGLILNGERAVFENRKPGFDYETVQLIFLQANMTVTCNGKGPSCAYQTIIS